MTPSRRRHEDLARAETALVRALEGKADPWRVVELRARRDRLRDLALEAEAGADPGLGPDGPPRPWGPVAPLVVADPPTRRSRT